MQEVKAAGAGYVEQAKGLATSAIHTAQVRSINFGLEFLLI